MALNVKTLKIVVVDNDPFILRTMSVILSDAFGINTFHLFSSVKTTISYLDRLSRNTPDIIFIDLSLLEINEMQLMRKLQEKNYLGGIIILSSDDNRVMMSSKEITAKYGFKYVEIIKKPVGCKDITNVFKNYLISTKQVTQNDCQLYVKKFTRKDLTNALRNEQFEVYFQPVVRANDYSLYGVEVLARCILSDRIVLPQEFIELAEQTGQIGALTYIVFSKALSYLHSWGSKYRDLKMAFNLSPQSLGDHELAKHIRNLAYEKGANEMQISLELTERSLVNNVAPELENLTRSRMRRFRFAVDDFGSGFEASQVLSNMPFSELKIYRGFISNLTDNQESQEVVKNTVAIAEKLGVEVVVAGVETKEDWMYLQKLNKNLLVQGYFIAKPMSAEEFVKWHAKWIKCNPSSLIG